MRPIRVQAKAQQKSSRNLSTQKRQLKSMPNFAMLAYATLLIAGGESDLAPNEHVIVWHMPIEKTRQNNRSKTWFFSFEYLSAMQ